MSVVLETPSIPPLEAQISELVEREVGDQISVTNFVLHGLQLGAQRIDQLRIKRGETANAAAVLGEVLNSREAKEQLTRGNRGGEKLAYSREIGEEDWSLCQKIDKAITDRIGSNLAHGPFIQEIVGIGKSTVKQHWRPLDKNIDILPEKMRALVYLDLLGGVACQTMRAPVEKLLDLQTNPGIMTGKERDFWESRIFGYQGKEGIKFCEGYTTKISPIIDKQAQKLFRKNAQRAINLWRAVINIKMSDPPISPDFFQERKSFFEALARRDIDTAETKVKKWLNSRSYDFRFDPKSSRLLAPLLENNAS